MTGANMTTTEYATLKSSLEALEGSMKAMEQHTTNLIKALYGVNGLTNGGGVGLVAQVAMLRSEVGSIATNFDRHVDAHQRDADKSDSRTWDVFRLIVAPIVAGVVGAALVAWGLQ